MGDNRGAERRLWVAGRQGSPQGLTVHPKSNRARKESYSLMFNRRQGWS